VCVLVFLGFVSLHFRGSNFCDFQEKKMHASNVKLVDENVAKQKQFNQGLVSKL